MKVMRVGDQALLVEVADSAHAQALYAEARRRKCPAVDVVPGARTVLFDGVPDSATLAEELLRWRSTSPAPHGARLVEVPTTYDGADLDEVADCWGMSRSEVVRMHSSTTFTVAFCGFAPGFAYCTGLPAQFSVPRRRSPRLRVPSGAVGLAGPYTGVYPRASPGGWQLIGRTELALWDPAADPPALLAPGTTLRFIEVRG